MTVYTKDPNAVLDYKVDWGGWLADSETIATSDFTVPDGLTRDTQSNTTTDATVWLSGGTTGQTYVVTNRIITNQGRTDDRSITIAVRER